MLNKSMKLAQEPKTLEQLQEEVFQLNLRIDILKAEEAAEALKQSKCIDFSKIPANTKVVVRDCPTSPEEIDYFLKFHYGSEYPYEVTSGRWKQIKLLDNPIIVWFKGDSCPIPDNIKFNLWLRGGDMIVPKQIRDNPNANTLNWTRGLTDGISDYDIIAYQILESNFQS